jgi:hypothetical protein
MRADSLAGGENSTRRGGRTRPLSPSPSAQTRRASVPHGNDHDCASRRSAVSPRWPQLRPPELGPLRVVAKGRATSPGQQFANTKPQPHEIAPRNSNKTITKLQNQQIFRSRSLTALCIANHPLARRIESRNARSKPDFAGRVGGFVGPIDPPLYSRRHFITCKFCQPSKLFPLMPVSDVPHR